MDMGATPTPAGVRFKVWAPKPQRVEIELADTRELVLMDRDADDMWSAVVPQARPGTRYWYRLDGRVARPDPYSRSQPEGPHGPSEVVDPNAFRWRDENWRGQGIQGLVIYQLHIGTATPDGTFDSLIDQLPRLKALGVNALEPLPVAEFPGERNWGYDGVDLFAPAHVYGGPEAMKRFVDAAHQHGLAVILDLVYNHFGPDGNYLRDFSADYFTDRYHTPWGEAINYDGPRAKWVRQLVLDNARYWLHEYHVDGFRLDATHAIYDSSPQHLLGELTQAVRGSLPLERQIALTAETHENNVRYLKPVAEGGFGFDAVWADDFHHTVRRYLAGDHEGYYADYVGTLDEVARCIEQGWLYEGQGTPRSGFEEKRGTPARDRPAWQFIYTLQNHDLPHRPCCSFCRIPHCSSWVRNSARLRRFSSLPITRRSWASWSPGAGARSSRRSRSSPIRQHGTEFPTRKRNRRSVIRSFAWTRLWRPQDLRSARSISAFCISAEVITFCPSRIETPCRPGRYRAMCWRYVDGARWHLPGRRRIRSLSGYCSSTSAMRNGTRRSSGAAGALSWNQVVTHKSIATA